MQLRRQAPMCVALAVVLACSAARADEPERTGPIVTGVGIGAAVVGLGLVVGGAAQPCTIAVGGPEEGPCAYGRGSDTAERGWRMMQAGIAISVIGDVTWIIGAIVWRATR